MPFDATSTNPKYDENVESWALMRDTIAGEDVVKSKDEDYLPMKSGTAALAVTDPDLASQAYQAYKLRAEFPEIVAPTVRGSVGVMFENMPTIELPTQMEMLLERATQDGLTLEQLIQRVAMELMAVGRYGLLPSIDEKGIPYIACYTTENIRNWDVPTPEDGWVLLDESRNEIDRETGEWDYVFRYREAFVLNGQYTARVWEQNGADTSFSIVDGSQIGASMPPANGQARPLPFLPMVFINVNDLGPDPDDIPLYGLGRIAIRVYRMDADYTFSLHMTSEPTPVAIGFDNPSDAVKNGNAPTTVGSSKMWLLPKGGDAKYLEFSGPGIQAQQTAIQDALKRAATFGAQLFDESKAKESGDALAMRIGSRQSTLKTIAMNTAMGVEKALKNLAIWMGLDPATVSVKPNLDFADHTLTAQDITALVNGWMAGGYSHEVLFWNLQRGGVIDPERTIEEEQAAIEADGLAAAAHQVEVNKINPPPEPPPANPPPAN